MNNLLKLYMNKRTGQLAIITPHWQPIVINFDQKFYEELDPAIAQMIQGRKIAHGVLCQVGWLVQNEHEVWFGLPLSVIDQFEEIGDVS